jgi:hypothetical protein
MESRLKLITSDCDIFELGSETVCLLIMNGSDDSILHLGLLRFAAPWKRMVGSMHSSAHS